MSNIRKLVQGLRKLAAGSPRGLMGPLKYYEFLVKGPKGSLSVVDSGFDTAVESVMGDGFDFVEDGPVANSRVYYNHENGGMKLVVVKVKEVPKPGSKTLSN